MQQDKLEGGGGAWRDRVYATAGEDGCLMELEEAIFNQ